MLMLSVAACTAQAMDTDIYTLNSGTNNAAPNVLIVLDNTSNWSRADQHWPDSGINQGQAEVQAIKTVIQSLNANVNIGLLEFVTGGPSTDNGGFVRQAIVPMGPNQSGGPANQAAFTTKLTTIYNNTTSSNEKQNSGEAYGNLMYDAYNYLAGVTPFASGGHCVSSITDVNGYTSSSYTMFKSPLSAAAGCVSNYIIFIGNPNAQGPVADSAANTTVLSALGGITAQLKLPNFTVTAHGTGLATDVATGTSTLDTNPFNADEWTRFMYQTGIPVGTARQTASTYTIDVWYSAPNAQQSGLLSSMAKNGGGKYFTATNEAAIAASLQSIFSEILAANSTFASASLPISATNRAQNDNQVYIGMFRPNPNSLPRWFGNLKRYQIANFSGAADLADINGLQATNTTTGFITPCAVSWWTTDSGNYWANVSGSTVGPRVFFTTENTPGLSWGTQGDDTNLATNAACPGNNVYSDQPDGPIVEKGGVAEMLRKSSSRNMLTLSGASLVPFNTSNATISSNATINTNLVNFILGQDVTGEINATASTANRPSIHGDVIHSKPIPVDYGGTTGVMVYYGANDGTYRAVNAATGNETWSFVAPEFYPGLERLLDNNPIVSSSNPKSFYFDGSTGIYQTANNTSVWIYPVMRRGGRMIYAFDASNPSSPAFMWKAGCPDLADNTGCTTGLSNIGQTWSTPTVAFLSGYSTTKPVVIVGGGYDACEDADTSSPVCSGTTGNGAYVFDAQTGSLLASFSTIRSVAADISLVDINYDGTVDAAYVADTGGNIYRIDFSDPTNSFAAKSAANWSITRVAYTSGAGRKFLFAPAVLAYNNQVYLAIGSGDREHPLITNYPYTTPVTNRFYLYLDDPEDTNITDLDGSSMFNNTIDPNCGNNQVLPEGSKTGWYMDLTAYGTGEQTVTSALITGGLITFSTNRPLAGTANSCTNPLGEARGYWVNLLNGSGAVGTAAATCTPAGGVDANGNTISRSTTFVGGGLPPSPVVGNVSVGGTVETVVIGAAQKTGRASSSIGGQLITPPISSHRKRVYWRTNSDTH